MLKTVFCTGYVKLISHKRIPKNTVKDTNIENSSKTYEKT